LSTLGVIKRLKDPFHLIVMNVAILGPWHRPAPIILLIRKVNSLLDASIMQHHVFGLLKRRGVDV